MSIIEAIKQFLADCPLLFDSELNVNYLSHKPLSFSIENVSVNPIIKRYSDGATLRQYCFILASREAFDDSVMENLRTADFFENFERWIDEQNLAHILPDLSNLSCSSQSIEVVESGCMYDTATTSARFQIKLRLIYKQNY